MEALIFNIDMQKLSDAGLSPNDFCAIYLAYKNASLETPYYSTNWEQLEEEGWIKVSDKIYPRPKFLSLISEQETVSKVKEWVDEWLNLWPEGVKGGAGKYVKSNREDTLFKLNSFVKRYKKYTKNQIMEATKFYLEDRKRQNWAMIQEAHYFILKSGVSSLAAAIDNLDKREKTYQFHNNV